MNNERKGPKCRNCQKFGHIARNCRAKNQSAGVTKKNHDSFSCVLSAVNSQNKKDSWYFDSGATSHMSFDRNNINRLFADSGTVVAANKGEMKVKGCGTATIYPACNTSTIEVSDVKFIPDLSINLLSVGRIVKQGHTVEFTEKSVKVINARNQVIATGTNVDDLFVLDTKPSKDFGFACGSKSSKELWHRRMGHLNNDSLDKLNSGLATGIGFTSKIENDCKICAVGKQTRLRFNKCGSRANQLLEVVHTDICGPMENTSLGGNRYFLTFVDDKSRKIFVYFLKTKMDWEVLSCFEDFCALAENQSGYKIKTIRSDNGKEFLNNKFQDLLRKKGIQHQTSNVHTPEQNGLAERNNRSIVEKSRCMLADANLPKVFWAEAVGYSVYLLNRSPSKGTGKTPVEAWSAKVPNLAHIKVFGTTAMAHIPKANRRKWDPKAKESILVGYDEHTKGYRLYDPVKKCIFKSRDVSFINEDSSGAKNSNSNTSQSVQVEFLQHEVVDKNVAESVPVMHQINDELDDSQFENSSTFEDAISNDESDQIATSALPQQSNSNPLQQQVLRRSERERKIPGKYNEFVLENDDSVLFSNPQNSNNPEHGISPHQTMRSSLDEMESLHGFSGLAASPSHLNRPDLVENQKVSKPSDARRILQGKYPENENLIKVPFTVPDFQQNDPETPEEAMLRPDAHMWRLAMEEEMQSLIANDTWTLKELPKNRSAIKCKWVFRTKLDVTGQIDRYKARLVIKGYSQRKGVDYDETYSPVVRHSSLRYLFALAAELGLSISQMDAITAFLQGQIAEEIYMEQPKYFKDKNNPSMVCKLNKALYGLKQSSRIWNQKLDAVLQSLGLQKSKYDHCVYHSTKEHILFVAVYVDDLLFFTNNEKELKTIKAELHKVFQIKELGTATQVLGMRITYNEESIALDQEHYIEKVLEKFEMKNSNPVKTPMNSSEKLCLEDGPANSEEAEQMKSVPYQEAIGCLMYLSQCTRPDICFAVNCLSRFNSNPGPRHWLAVKHLLRYLRGTSSLKLRFNKGGHDDIVGYTDADWASNIDDRKSTTGFVFIAQGGAISWCSKRQSTVALSSCEAEFMALSATVQEALWWNGLKHQLSKRQQPLRILCDNQSAIAIATNGGFHPRSKHIDIRHYFVQDTINKGKIKLENVRTDNQIADALTKPLDRIKISSFRDSMGIRP